MKVINCKRQKNADQPTFYIMNLIVSPNKTDFEIVDHLRPIDFFSFLFSIILHLILFYLIETQTILFDILWVASAILILNAVYIVLMPFKNQFVAFSSFSISLIPIIVTIKRARFQLNSN